MGQKTTVKQASEPSYVLKDLDKAAEVALFYGFRAIKSPCIIKEDIEKTAFLNDEKKMPEYRPEIFPRGEEKASVIRTYLDWNVLEAKHPVMLYYRRPLGGASERRPINEHHSALEIIGSASSVCEAIAIKTASAILSDHGYKDLIVDINSIGDKDSITRLELELSSYIRKHINFVPAELRTSFRKNPFDAISCEDKGWASSKERMPQAMSCLSESSINNFKEVLEYLESLEIPYRLVHNLVPNRQYCSHTFFQIRDNVDENFVFAVGTRHNHLTRKLGFKRDVPIMSVNLRFKKPAVMPKLFFKNRPQPKFYFIQLGLKAKLKSLTVIEMLRQAQIPLHHSLTRDQFVDQLSGAENTGVPFIIIMGQKEALENTVVVRHMATRVQETVPLGDLVRHLSKIK